MVACGSIPHPGTEEIESIKGDGVDGEPEDGAWSTFRCVAVVSAVGWVLSFTICVTGRMDLMSSAVVGMISTFVIGSLSTALYRSEIPEVKDQISGS